MFGIGWTEAIFIAIIVLLFVGPDHLPGMLRRLGRIVADLKNASRELQNQLELETRDLRSAGDLVRDIRHEAAGVKQEALDLARSPYDEARRLDEELRQGLAEAADPGPAPANTGAEGGAGEPGKDGP